MLKGVSGSVNEKKLIWSGFVTSAVVKRGDSFLQKVKTLHGQHGRKVVGKIRPTQGSESSGLHMQGLRAEGNHYLIYRGWLVDFL